MIHKGGMKLKKIKSNIEKEGMDHTDGWGRYDKNEANGDYQRMNKSV